MDAGRKTYYLGRMRLLLILLALGAPCVVAQEDKSKLRTWTSSIGTKIEAELVSTTGDEVTLKTKAGRTLTVPLNKLSKADQEFAAAQSSPQEPAKGGVPVTPDLKYETKDDTVTITGWDRDASGALTIPATIEGKTVTSIEAGAFAQFSNLTSITIGDSVTRIEMSAFSGCTNLTSITIGDSVTSIGKYAFSQCGSLTNITISDSLTSIGNSAFAYCRSLKSITIPDSVTSIGDGAFWGTGLTSITIPDSVTSIGEYAFSQCGSLTSITIPDGVPSIGERAFYSCTSLTSITIPDGVTSIGNWAFEECTSLTAVTFLGDAPKAGEALFYKSTPTIYRNPEAKGWGETFDGRPVKLISEKP